MSAAIRTRLFMSCVSFGAIATMLSVTLVACGGGSASKPDASRATTPPVPVSSVRPVGLSIPSLKIKSTSPWQALGVQGRCQGGASAPDDSGYCVKGGRAVLVTPPGELGEIESPSVKDPTRLGWYCPNGVEQNCGSPAPGQLGPAVVVGHVNGGGKQGVFAKLSTLKPDTEIDVTRADGSVAVFVTQKVQKIAKDQFPTDAVYGDTDAPTLRLITCGGRLDTKAHNYLDQYIAYAALKEIRSAPSN